MTLPGSDAAVRRGRPHDHRFCVAVLTRRDHGLVVSEISRALGLSDTRVRSILKRHDAATALGKRQPTTVGRVDEIKVMFSEGATQTAIAARIGVSRERIRQVLTEGGVETRRPRHKCDDLCAAIMTEAAAARPVDVAVLARRFRRPYSSALRRAQVHGVTFRSRGNHHICDARCERVRSALEGGGGITAAFVGAGLHPASGGQRYRSYHPEFKWPIAEWWMREKAEPGEDAAARSAIRSSEVK